MIRDWISACETSHKRCNNLQTKRSRLPLRLIDVDPNGEVASLVSASTDVLDPGQASIDSFPQVRLRETASLPEETKYLTLSHRWDTVPSMRLGHDTRQDMLGSDAPISVSILNNPGSRIFKEAIEVTRALGFSYLWIDAVCINQDDPDEKDIEISFMGQIYQAASLNISASGATRGADGLFFARDPSGPSLEYDFLIDESPVNKRGWVYQERLLSPRIIHFTREEVCWECFSDHLAPPRVTLPKLYDFFPPIRQTLHFKLGSSFPYKLRLKDTVKGRLALFRLGMYAALSGSGEVDGQDSHLWAVIVAQYSKLDLSFEQDRLPAISAVARVMYANTNIKPEKYLAGFWRNTLPYHLTWTVIGSYRGEIKGRQAGAQYIAPSWSWASVGAGVSLRHREAGARSTPGHIPIILPDIVDVNIATQSGDQFGQIVSGSLHLRCRLLKCVWNSLEKRVEGTTQGGKTVKQAAGRMGPFWLYWDFDAFKSHTSGVPLSNGQKKCIVAPSIWLTVTEVLRDCWQDVPPSYSSTYGLILYRTAQRGQYVRLGVFKYQDTDRSSILLSDGLSDEEYMDKYPTLSDDFRLALSGEEQTLDENDYLTREGGGKVIIELV